MTRPKTGRSSALDANVLAHDCSPQPLLKGVPHRVATLHPVKHNSFPRSAQLSPLLLSTGKRLRFFLAPSTIAAVLSLLTVNQVIAWTERPAPVQVASLTQSWSPTLAQVLQERVLTRQGNQVILNGTPLAAIWSTRQNRIGLADSSLLQMTGVTLLSTQDVTRQPIQWFSNPETQPYILNTWLTSQYRFLDITDLAPSLGWQLQVEGGTLRITTPTAQVLGIRQGRQVWGDRLVVDLDRAATWRVAEQGNVFTVTVDGRLDPAIAQAFKPMPGNLIRSLSVVPGANQTQIRFEATGIQRLFTFTLPTPNRLVIDLRPDYLVEQDILWAPGIRWQQRVIRQGSSQFPATILELNPRQAGLRIKPIWSDPASLPGISPLITMAQRWQVAAAINGGFFNRNNQLPLGAVRVDNRWISGPILNRGAIGWNDAGDTVVGNLSLQESIVTADGQRLPIFSLNSGFVGAGISRYTPEWGAVYNPIQDGEIIVTVRGDRVVSQQPGGPAAQTAFPIPPDGYLLTIRANPNLASLLPVGSSVRSQLSANPPAFDQVPHIMGGGPLLIQNRRVVVNPAAEGFSEAFIRQGAPRSAIAKTQDGTMLLVAVHNRFSGSGPTLGEMAQIMQQLGAVDALNLDGGSSTSLYLGGQLLNRSPRTAARVHNGIGIFLQPSP